MPPTQFQLSDDNRYLFGLLGSHRSEAIPGAIPNGVAQPLRHELGLYHERITAAAFVSRREDQKQSDLYRIMSSYARSDMVAQPSHRFNIDYEQHLEYLPVTSVWLPHNIEENNDFLQGIRWIGGTGSPKTRSGFAYYAFSATLDMPERQAFFNSDGDFLIVPQQGTLDVRTEFGNLRVRPCEICVIPAGIAWSVSLPDGNVRGFMMEIFEGHFQLPSLGVVGGYGLANEQDFEIPTARYDSGEENFEILHKYNGKIFQATQKGSVFNVVGWRGSYFPYKFDLGRFKPIGALLDDHVDPSIFTVLSCESARSGIPLVEFGVFGPRWVIGEQSFRIPGYHRNTSSEFAALIQGGFSEIEIPQEMWGLSLLHSNYLPHGATKDELEQEIDPKSDPKKRVPNTHFAFLFESSHMIGLTSWALKGCGKFGNADLLGRGDPLNFDNRFKALEHTVTNT